MQNPSSHTSSNPRHTLNLLYFLAKHKLQLVLTGPRTTLANLGRIILLPIILMYAYGAGLFLNRLTDSGLPAEPYIAGFLLFSTIAMVSSGVFPTLKLPVDAIPVFAPLGPEETALANGIFNLLRPGFVYGVLFITTVAFMSPVFGWLLFVSCLVFFMAISLLEFTAKIILTKKPSSASAGEPLVRKPVFPYAIGLVLLILGLLQLFYPNPLLPVDPSAAALFLFCSGLLLSGYAYRNTNLDLQLTSGSYKAISRNEKSTRNIAEESQESLRLLLRLSIKHILRANIYRQLCGLMVLMYLIFSGLILYGMGGKVLVTFLILPIIPYSHVFNNFWGFFPALKMNTANGANSFMNGFLIYTFSLLPALLLNFILCFAAVFGLQSAHSHSPFLLILFFFVLIPMNHLIGYISSIILPIKVSQDVKLVEFGRTGSFTSQRISYLQLFLNLTIVITALNGFIVTAGIILLTATIITALIFFAQRSKLHAEQDLHMALFK